MRDNRGGKIDKIMLAAVCAFKNTIKYGGGLIFLYTLVKIHILFLPKKSFTTLLNHFKFGSEIFSYSHI